MKHALSWPCSPVSPCSVPRWPRQDKPSFAGTWKLADPATADEFTPTVMVVVQDATALTVTTTAQIGEFKRPPTSWMAANRRARWTSTGRRSTG